MSNKDHAARDALLESAAEAQTAKGMMPTPVDNAQYLTGVLENLDKRAAARSAAERPTTTKKPGAYQEEVRRRCERLGMTPVDDYTVTRKEKPIALGGAVYTDRVMGTAEKRMRARLRLIRSRPEWAAKLHRINPYALQGHLGKDKQEEAANEVRKVLAQTNEKWGDWWRQTDRPLWFGGKALKPDAK